MEELHHIIFEVKITDEYVLRLDVDVFVDTVSKTYHMGVNSIVEADTGEHIAEDEVLHLMMTKGRELTKYIETVLAEKEAVGQPLH